MYYIRTYTSNNFSQEEVYPLFRYFASILFVISIYLCVIFYSAFSHRRSTPSPAPQN